MNISLGNVLDFVIANKSNKTFLGYTKEQIAWILQKAVNEGTILVRVNDNGNIVGMIIAEIQPEKQVLYVTENLAMNLANLRHFATIAKDRYPGLTLRWQKHGIQKHHSTERIYNKLAL